MKTEIFEADAFTGRKEQLLATLDSDYRWEKGDEIVINTGPNRWKVRVTWVQVTLESDGPRREVVALKI
ncbi:MAG: hypothetical protein WEB00_03705 [Dehalococcoidia bacterium]